jgi:PIN domain nuclease of toxin-antitoxin system
MRLLLDTHTFLWFIDGNAALSPTARALIEDPANERYVSIASSWELAIKYSLGRIQLSQPFHLFLPQQLQQNRMAVLGIAVAHTAVIATLPYHHKDPFDRMIIAQAFVESLPVISIDTIFDAYGVDRIWEKKQEDTQEA